MGRILDVTWDRGADEWDDEGLGGEGDDVKGDVVGANDGVPKDGIVNGSANEAV